MRPQYLSSYGKAFLRTALVTVTVAVPLSFAASSPAHALVCGRGFYRAGCAGPNGAVVVRRPGYGVGYRPYYHGGYYRGGYYRGPAVTCARGPYRAGCAGPNGVVVRPY